MQQELQVPVQLDSRAIPVSVSIGVAINGAEDLPRPASALLQDADTAMYRVKASGRGRIEVFDADLQRQALERLDAEAHLRRAIDDGDLVVHYQPVVRSQFIALAEETGLIGEIGEWVLRIAIRDVGDWARQAIVLDSFRLAVNVSARQLADPSLPDVVADALRAWPLQPGNLVLEITETAVMTDDVAARSMLERLDALGVTLALDDFGVGHSSLGQLARSLPISILKLDRSFVAGMADPRDRGIVEAVAALADSLHLESLAEGVEHPDQAEALAGIGFRFAQGYHFGRPADAAGTAAALAGVAS